MIAPSNLTPTEKRLFDILADGDWHSKESLLEPVTGMKFASKNAIPTHVDRMRKKLDGIVIEHEPGHGYRMVSARGGANG